MMSPSCESYNTFGQVCMYMILLYISMTKSLLTTSGHLDIWSRNQKSQTLLDRLLDTFISLIIKGLPSLSKCPNVFDCERIKQ
jgi:hypothetical protein